MAQRNGQVPRCGRKVRQSVHGLKGNGDDYEQDAEEKLCVLPCGSAECSGLSPSRCYEHHSCASVRQRVEMGGVICADSFVERRWNTDTMVTGSQQRCSASRIGSGGRGLAQSATAA